MSKYDLNAAAPATRTLDSLTGISKKGLPQGTVGVLGALVIGLSTLSLIHI